LLEDLRPPEEQELELLNNVLNPIKPSYLLITIKNYENKKIQNRKLRKTYKTENFKTTF
jgi:hypothetical protein